jgi:dTDP-4-dehydrorhamnose 3,5-epimerase-like enzyme
MKPELLNGGLAADDRGFVRFVNDFNFTNIKRFYQVSNHKKDFIRAWHGHKEEEKYVYVVSGTALVGAVNMETNELFKFTLSDKKPSILKIPKGFANGFKTLEENTQILFFSSSTLEESLKDDIRFDYNKWDIWEESYR